MSIIFSLLLLFLLFNSNETQKISVQNQNETSSTRTIIADTEAVRKILADFIFEDLHSMKPQNIRAKHEDGCLDGGCCDNKRWNWVHTQKDKKCPDFHRLKWRMQGPLILFVQNNTNICLDIVLPLNDPQHNSIVTTKCRPESKSQEWTIRLWPGQISNAKEIVYFSIESQLYRNTCVHIVDNDKLINDLYLIQPDTHCVNVENVCLLLSECNGNYWQSFYLERLRWKEYLSHIKEINGRDDENKIVLEPMEMEYPNYIFYTVGGIGICMIVSILGAIFFWRKYKRAKNTLRKLTRQEVNKFLKGNPKKNGNFDAHEDALNAPYNKKFEIKMFNLLIDENTVLGKGVYGIVYGGHFKMSKSKPDVPVAVKTTGADADVEQFKALLGEIKIMAYVGKHENVVEFLGFVTTRIKQGSVYIVMELSPFGNLLNFLRDRRNDLRLENLQRDQANYYLDLADLEETSQLLVRSYENHTKLRIENLHDFAHQIATGMEFLVSKNVVHGDLALRNILVFDGNLVKITDFGMSLNLYYQTYIKTNSKFLPFRWMSPESLTDLTFSTQSDLWSFGILLWEIFSLAEIPYSNILQFTQDFITSIQKGFRLHRPRLASPEIYGEMTKCWHMDPNQRPNFTQLKTFFEPTSRNQ